MVAEAPTQDMPPPGGYSKITYQRIPAKSYFKGWHLFAGLVVCKICAFSWWYRCYMKKEYEKVENRSARLAILPLLGAERDRGILRQLRINRDEEEKLMANVPNWEVGKLFNEPAYKTVKDDEWIEPIAFDYFAHSTEESIIDRAFFKFKHF